VTLTITSPPGAGTNVGPGYFLAVSQSPSLGVIGQSFWIVQLIHGGSTVPISMRLGWTGPTLNTYLGAPNELAPLAAEQGKLFEGLRGDPVDLELIMFISSTQQGEQLRQSQVWDPTDQAYNLFSQWAGTGGGGGHDPMLDTILAAVQHVYVNAA
jgi:hypothetical protein